MKMIFGMVLLLIILLSALGGFNAAVHSKSAIHEIEALICGVIFTLAVGFIYLGLKEN